MDDVELEPIFYLEVSTSIALNPDLDWPDDFMPKYNVVIKASTEETEVSGELETAGRVTFYKSQSIPDMKCNLFDVLDSHNDSLAELIGLFDDDGYPKAPFSDKVGEDAYFSHILYLYTIEIVPKYRKTGLTKAVTERILESFLDDQDHSLILLHACPINPEAKMDGFRDGEVPWDVQMGYKNMSKDRESAKMKLKQKYENELSFHSTGIPKLLYRYNGGW